MDSMSLRAKETYACFNTPFQLVLRRRNDSLDFVDFSRGFSDYKSGFGNVSIEDFYIGALKLINIQVLQK